MSDPPSLRERWLTELRRELRPLGRRRRRGVLAEASDHLISAIEDEIAAGASREDAEQRAVARFGEPAVIGASLCAVRPRSRRLAPAAVAAGAFTAVLALAAGPIADGIAPRPAVAADSPAPSPRRCARAFDQSANVTVRQLVSASTVLRVQILPTSVPSCVIRFQLSNRRVLTAQSPWRVGAATAWDVTIRRNGLVGGGGNAVWRGGRLTATGPDAGVVVRLGPAPTVDTCVDAWNAAPPPAVTSAAPGPALVQALSGGVYIAIGRGRGQLPGNGGYACAVWLAGKPGRATLVTGAWRTPHSATWSNPIRIAGMLGGAAPNADLAGDGRLAVRTPPTTRQVPPNPSANLGVTRQIGATGWAGGFKLHDTLAAAGRRSGTPAQETPRDLGCQVSWPALGLSAVFEFGFVRKGPHRQQPTPCGPTAMAMSLTGASTWSTSQGLRVGAPEADIERLYPGASRTTSPSTGVTTYYLVPRTARPGALSLTAQVALGSVISITVAASGVTFGFDIIG